MGDDLIFAQKFTHTAADGLTLLVEMENPRSAPEASVVIDMMTTLQRGAKRLRARHIYSGAQGVLSALHHEDDTTLKGRIECLGSLVTEYARGLNELTPEPVTPPQRTTAAKWDIARETLNSLLPFAPTSDADMLSRLMRAPVTLEGVQPDYAPLSIETEAEIVSIESGARPTSTSQTFSDPIQAEPIQAEPIQDIDGAPNIAPLVLAKADRAKPVSATQIEADDLSVTLDAMMRDVIADALSVARTVGRTISLSYDMGERSETPERAENLRLRLGQALSQIIRQSMTDDRVGHIDINLAGEQIHILTGKTAIRVAIDPLSAPAAKPLITPQTEQGLRSQLNALMDPISLHETAS